MCTYYIVSWIIVSVYIHVHNDYIHGLLPFSGEKKLPITVLITTTLITILLIVTVLAVIATFVIRQHNKKSKAYLLSGCV